MTNVAKQSRANPTQALRANDLITGKECIAIVKYAVQQETTALAARVAELEMPRHRKVARFVRRVAHRILWVDVGNGYEARRNFIPFRRGGGMMVGS